jgi:multidrug efflux pump
MLYMSSQATTDGLMTLTVTFKLGTDPDKAQQLVQNRVFQAEPRLPEPVRRLGITTVKSSPDLTMVVHLLSPNDRYDMTYLRNYAVLNVKDRLARIEGVGDVRLFGAGDYAMRVWLDPQKLAERGLSASDIVREIRAQNVEAAGGFVGASPSVPGLDLQLAVNARGRLQSEEEFGDIVVRSGTTGEVTRCATSPASSSALRNTRCARCSTTSRRSQSPSTRPPARTRSRSPTTCARRWPS